MKKILFFTFALVVLQSCSGNMKKQSEVLDLEEIGKFALNKPIKFIIDSLRLNADKLTFIDESPGIVSSISVNYKSKGTVEFFFEPSSLISYDLNSREEYLSKIADKIIEKVEWKYANGKKGSIKNVIVY